MLAFRQRARSEASASRNAVKPLPAASCTFVTVNSGAYVFPAIEPALCHADEFPLQPRACRDAGLQVPAIDDGKPEAPRRHGMALGITVFVERDLHARYIGKSQRLFNGLRWRMTIAGTLGSEQHHAVSVATVGIGKVPGTAMIESDQRIDPTATIEVRPLVAEAQMHFDDPAASRFEVEHAGIVGHVRTNPCAAVGLDFGMVGGVDGPEIECSFGSRSTGDVAPPSWLAGN